MNVEDGVSVAIDFVIIFGSGTILQICKAVCRKKIYPFIATNAAKLDAKDRLNWHFSKQLWGLTWHTFIFIFELIVLIPSDFWISIIYPYNKQYGTSLLWTNINNPILPSTGIRLLYLLQIGYYLLDIFYQTLIDIPNDVIIMSIHHISALLLLFMSYLPPTNCWKIGCAVLLVHEIGDVSIYLCKTLHYAQFELTANILFVVNILIWICSRLIWYPRIVLSLFIDIKHPAPLKTNIWQYIPCAILLCTLYILHIYWVYLMNKVLYNAVIKKKTLADPRDANNPMMHEKETNVDIVDHDDNNVNVEMDAIEIDVKDDFDVDEDQERTDVIQNELEFDNDVPTVRRRSSLVGDFILERRNSSMAINAQHE